MHNLQVSPPFSAAVMTVSEHIANDVLDWHLEGESPEPGQDIFSVIYVRKVMEHHSSCPALSSPCAALVIARCNVGEFTAA